LAISLQAQAERWPIAGAFRIARGAKTEACVVTVRLTHDGAAGWGECVPYARYGETPESVLAQIEAVRSLIENGADRVALGHAMPPGAARNALDCALWDLEAKRAGAPVWALAGLPEPGPATTAFTLSLDEPDAMAQAARAAAGYPLLKLKIGGAGDLARLAAVAAARPDARLIIDANEGLNPETLPVLLTQARALNVELIEQPFPADADVALEQIAAPVALCADESLHTSADVERLARRYDAVNVKLDKTGGLTEGLALKDAALTQGFGLMVGCMVGSSLAMAPATLLAQGAAFTDLDGPLLLAEDRDHPLRYDEAGVHPPEPGLWG
jgi:L-alanine-DL-glutamate epimerase-like enolase superfamily enzyme